MADDFSVADYLKEQLTLTRTTWARLQEYGVADGSELQLDFFYAAPTNGQATELKRFLEEETDYTVRVTADRDHWILRGHTQRAPLSLAMVRTMGRLDGDRGAPLRVVFDGWGAEAP